MTRDGVELRVVAAAAAAAALRRPFRLTLAYLRATSVSGSGNEREEEEA